MFIEENENGLIYMRSDIVGARHAFTTRFGGVSGGEFATLNLGSGRGDDDSAVRENYRRVCALFGVDENGACVTRQVHQNVVRTVTAADRHPCLAPVPYEADGIVTASIGLPLFCFSADCVPVLLWDAKGRRGPYTAAGAAPRRTFWETPSRPCARSGRRFLTCAPPSAPPSGRAALRRTTMCPPPLTPG